VSELRERITITEFLDWLEFLRREEERRTKQDVYLAQIAKEIRRANVKHPNKVRVEDFYLEVVKDDVRDKEANTKKSKAAWLKALNVKTKGRNN